MKPLLQLPITLPRRGTRSLLISLHNQLRTAILDARLKPGVRLPSTRAGQSHNLTNRKYLEEIIPAPEFGGSFIHDSYGRSYGLSLAYRFGK